MDDELDRLEAELGNFEDDPQGWCMKAAEAGYAATFVPCIASGTLTICMGAWSANEIALSDDARMRAVAAICYCNFARRSALELGALLP